MRRAKGEKLMSLKLLVDHDTFLRPGESIDIKARDAVPPVRGGGASYRWHCIVVRDQEWGRPDKVGIFDNTVPLNSKGREWLGEYLHARASKMNAPNLAIYPFTAAQHSTRESL